MRHLLSPVLAAAAVILTTPPAPAQMMACGARDAIVERLDGTYAESRRGHGLQPGRGVLEIFASEGGSWTLLLTLPNGASCILAAGEAWSPDAPLETPVGDPA